MKILSLDPNCILCINRNNVGRHSYHTLHFPGAQVSCEWQKFLRYLVQKCTKSCSLQKTQSPAAVWLPVPSPNSSAAVGLHGRPIRGASGCGCKHYSTCWSCASEGEAWLQGHSSLAPLCPEISSVSLGLTLFSLSKT